MHRLREEQLWIDDEDHFTPKNTNGFISFELQVCPIIFCIPPFGQIFERIVRRQKISYLVIIFCKGSLVALNTVSDLFIKLKLACISI